MVKVSKKLILIPQKNRLDALSATQKTLGLKKVQFLKKSRKTLKNWSFFAILAEKGNFWRFFLIFSVTILVKDLRFSALCSVPQDDSFELSKSKFQKKFKFSIIRADPLD